MDSDANKATGNVLRHLRKTAGLTQAQLADKLNKPQSYVSKIESGERGFYVYELISFSSALDISPHNVVDHLCDALE